MEMVMPCFKEPLDAQDRQQCAHDCERIRESHRHPIGDMSAQNDQEEGDGLKSIIEHPEGEAVEPPAVLQPQHNHDQRVEDLDDEKAEYDRSDVESHFGAQSGSWVLSAIIGSFPAFMSLPAAQSTHYP